MFFFVIFIFFYTYCEFHNPRTILGQIYFNDTRKQKNSKDINEFEKAREELTRILEKKKIELKREMMRMSLEKEVELEKEFDTELTKLIAKFAPATSSHD